MLQSHLNIEHDVHLVRAKICIFALGRIDSWYYGIFVARSYRVCIIDPLGALGVLYIMYLALAKATVIIVSITTISIIAGNVGGLYKNKTNYYFPPGIGGALFGAQN